MKMLLALSAIILILGRSALADPAVKQTTQGKRKAEQKAVEQKTVFVTGSLIPKRIELRRTGTTTVSPVRIINRGEIDSTGRFTTQGAFVNEPAVRILGH